MHKKGSSHSNKLLIIEDPNAATARELRRMYSRLQCSIVQAIRSKLQQYETVLSGKSKPPTTTVRKSCRTMPDQSKSIQMSKGLTHKVVRSTKLPKQQKPQSTSLKLQQQKPRNLKLKATNRCFPLWNGTLPVSISDVTLFTSEGSVGLADFNITDRPESQGVSPEDEELIGLISSYRERKREPSRLSNNSAGEGFQAKIIKIQRFWRAYQTRKLIATYLQLMQQQYSRTTLASSKTASYQVNGQLEGELPSAAEIGRFEFGVGQDSLNPEEAAVAVEEAAVIEQAAATVATEYVREPVEAASQPDHSGVVFVDESASKSDLSSSYLIAEIKLTEETASRSAKKFSIPTKTNSDFKILVNEGDAVPGFVLQPEKVPSSPDQHKEKSPLEPSESKPANEITAVHRLPLLKMNELPQLATLYQSMLTTKYQEEINFLDEQLDSGIIEEEEYDEQLFAAQRWRKLKEQQLQSYKSISHKLAQDTETLLGELSIHMKLKGAKRSRKYLTNSLSDKALPLISARLRQQEMALTRTLSASRPLTSKGQHSLEFEATPHRKLPTHTNEQNLFEESIDADCSKLVRNLIVEALQDCLKSSYIKLKLRKLIGKATGARGIRTDELMVESFAKKLIEYILSQPAYIKHISKLKTPANANLSWIFRGYKAFEKLNEPSAELIMPKEVLLTLNKFIVNSLKLDKQLDNEELQAERVAFLHELISYHNMAIFNALNEELGRQRVPSVPNKLFLYQLPPLRKSEFSISNSITRAQQSLIEAQRLCLGVHPQKLFKQGPRNDPLLVAVRNDRNDKDLLQQVLLFAIQIDRQAASSPLGEYHEEVCYRLQISELVTATLMGEFLSQLHLLL